MSYKRSLGIDHYVLHAMIFLKILFKSLITEDHHQNVIHQGERHLYLHKEYYLFQLMDVNAQKLGV
jgi:hypothetical protein